VIQKYPVTDELEGEKLVVGHLLLGATPVLVLLLILLVRSGCGLNHAPISHE